ncbi:MAG: hypothetical protein RL693_1567 [Verrucomicrobiota bacterium]|jgi:hypothetical protein
MKTKLIALTLLIASSLLAHEGVELGPNGGRILEFSKNETMHGEVTAKDGNFLIAVLDKDMKPVAIEKQALTATSADREKPQKLTVEVKDNRFVVPILKGDDYHVILQFKLTPEAKAITARLHYNTSTCDTCKAPEWLCKCKHEKK